MKAPSGLLLLRLFSFGAMATVSIVQVQYPMLPRTSHRVVLEMKDDVCAGGWTVETDKYKWFGDPRGDRPDSSEGTLTVIDRDSAVFRSGDFELEMWGDRDQFYTAVCGLPG